MGALWCEGMNVHRGRRGRQQVGHGGLVEHSTSLNYYIGDEEPSENLIQGMTRLDVYFRKFLLIHGKIRDSGMS